MTDWTSVAPYFETEQVAHLATLMPDGGPHSVPVWVGVEGEALAIFMVAGSLKDTSIQRDPRVALSVTKPGNQFDMATVRGRVVERIEGSAAMPIIDRIATRYTGAPYDIRSGMVAFLVQPDRSWAADYSA